jgi:hypothetical protein
MALPLHPRHQSWSTDCLWFSIGDSDNDRITGVKERAAVGPKLSGLPGDPDYRGPDCRWTTAFKFSSVALQHKSGLGRQTVEVS